jgi:hypothetical protein
MLNGNYYLQHIADTLIIDCVNPPALKSLRPFSGDENGIKNSLILVDKLLSSASETKDLYKRLGQLLSGFLFPLNIQQVPTEMMDSSMQTVLSCIFATVTDFEKECDQEMQHYHGYLDMICRYEIHSYISNNLKSNMKSDVYFALPTRMAGMLF